MTSTLRPPIFDQGADTEDYPLSAVPTRARKSFMSLAPLLIGCTLYSGTLFAGGIVGTAVKFWPDLIGLILISNLILGFYAMATPNRMGSMAIAPTPIFCSLFFPVTIPMTSLNLTSGKASIGQGKSHCCGGGELRLPPPQK